MTIPTMSYRTAFLILLGSGDRDSNRIKRGARSFGGLGTSRRCRCAHVSNVNPLETRCNGEDDSVDTLFADGLGRFEGREPAMRSIKCPEADSADDWDPQPFRDIRLYPKPDIF